MNAMLDFTFSPKDIAAILHSMALSDSKGAFIPGKELSPESMSPEKRLFHALWAIEFFGLPSQYSQELRGLSSWGDWAEALHSQLSQKCQDALCFRTSGSTGNSVLHRFSPADFAGEIDSLLPFFTSRKRVVSVMPVHHVFGFVFALLLPKALRIASIAQPPLPTRDFFKALQPGDLLLAFPIFWKSLAAIRRENVVSIFPDDLQGISSTAPCPPEIIEDLLDTRIPGPLAVMTEIYGATEFGAVGIRWNGREPYTLLPHWSRIGLSAQAEAKDNAPENWGICRKNGDAQPLPDIVDWRDERRFTPVKRKDFAVQVGGCNVFPFKVAALLRKHPLIKDATVRLMRPEEGHRLKAFIIPMDLSLLESPRHFIQTIRSWSAQRLESAALPKHFRLGEEFPLTKSGKLADWSIGEETTINHTDGEGEIQ